MKVSELIEQDLFKLYPSVFNNPNTHVSFEDLMESDDHHSKKLLEELREEEGVKITERDDLVNFLSLMRSIDGTDHKEGELTEQKIREYIACNPGVRTFDYMLIFFLIDYYMQIEMFDSEWIDFYRSVFENHPELVDLDDFIQESFFLVPILYLECGEELYIDVFIKAVEAHPQKAILKYTLSLLYERAGDYANAIKYNRQFLDQIEEYCLSGSQNRVKPFHVDSISENDHLTVYLSLAEQYLNNNEHESSLEYISKLLDHYSEHQDDGSLLQSCFIDPIIIRLRIYMVQKNVEAFKDDFHLIQGKVESDFFTSENYTDVLDFSKNL